MDSISKKISNQRIEPAPSVLYIVGTPIGNLGDLSPRAKSILSKVSVIACEDSRRSGLLLKSFGAKANLLSFHKHNTKSRVPQLIAFLREGKSLALISDAGLPGISDPGEELITKARELNFDVICIPGPCAAITAIVSSGLPSQRFCFEGFLPAKGKERAKAIEWISKETRTTIIYESPHKLIKLLIDLSEKCGEDRPLRVARELTKIHEETIGNTINSVLKYFLNQKPIGEFTLVLGGAPSETMQKTNTLELINKMQLLLDNKVTARDAARKTSEETGLSRRYLYSLLHQVLLKKEKQG